MTSSSLKNRLTLFAAGAGFNYDFMRPVVYNVASASDASGYTWFTHKKKQLKTYGMCSEEQSDIRGYNYRQFGHY